MLAYPPSRSGFLVFSNIISSAIKNCDISFFPVGEKQAGLGRTRKIASMIDEGKIGKKVGLSCRMKWRSENFFRFLSNFWNTSTSPSEAARVQSTSYVVQLETQRRKKFQKTKLERDTFFCREKSWAQVTWKKKHFSLYRNMLEWLLSSMY